MFSCFSTKSVKSPSDAEIFEKMERELCEEYRRNIKAILNPIEPPVHPIYTRRTKISSYGTRILPQLVEDDDDNKFTCPICFEDKNLHDIRYTPCFHKFCKNCLTNVEKENIPKCPICRTSLISI